MRVLTIWDRYGNHVTGTPEQMLYIYGLTPRGDWCLLNERFLTNAVAAGYNFGFPILRSITVEDLLEIL